jgi:uncharacterized protein (TIGR02145 family)
MKISILTLIFTSIVVIGVSQDIIYTVSAEISQSKTALDSILVENLTTGNRTLFANLPALQYYQINLTKNAFWGTVGINDKKVESFFESRNFPGQLSVTFLGNATVKADISVFAVNGQKVFESKSKTILPGNTVDVKLVNEGVFFVRFVTPAETKTFKAIGVNQAANFDVSQTSLNIKNEVGKSGIIANTSQDNFLPGDTIRISVYKYGYYTRPVGKKIISSENVDFIFEVSTAVTDSISDAYVPLNELTTSIAAYDTLTGTVQITYTDENPGLQPGDIITVDVDTMIYLRKIVEAFEGDSSVTVTTEQAYMNELFINKKFKLHSGLMPPRAQLKSTSSPEEISKALTDEQGYLHPYKVVYKEKSGKVIVKSALSDMGENDVIIPVIDFKQDIRMDLYKKDPVHFYIQEGHVSVKSHAIFEFDYGMFEIKRFSYCLDSQTEFLTKLALDLTGSYEKGDKRKLFNVMNKTEFYWIGYLPFAVTYEVGIFGKYNLSAEGTLHADWGFKSNDTLKTGGTYTGQDKKFTPFIREYTHNDEIFPLNLEARLNASARFEVYPRADIKFYSCAGPYAEIVPYVLGQINAKAQTQVTIGGISESFLAWNSGVDLGLDFRLGLELSGFGLSIGFGPHTLNGPVWPLWKSPVDITLLTSLPGELRTGTTLTNVKFKVSDSFGRDVIACPVYVVGNGTFNKQILFTNASGEVTVDWTVPNTTGKAEFTATIYNADKLAIKEVKGAVNVIDVPKVTTLEVTGITQTTATCGGNITSDGNTTITARGVCWSTTTNPKITDNNTTDGTGTSSFTSNITGLTPDTTYYLRAYATNRAGTAYGDEKRFTTLSYNTDLRDGRTYETVIINGKEWMAENLAYLPAVHVPTDESYTEPRYYVYDFFDSNLTKAKQHDNYKTYGVLYNWPAALAACPAGWHLPTHEEWTALENYLISEGYNYDGTTTDNKIAKALAANILWVESLNEGAVGNDLSLNNTSGFSALPSGFRGLSGHFHNIGYTFGLWSSTKSDYSTYTVWTFHISWNLDNTQQGYGYETEHGLGVRCVRD